MAVSLNASVGEKKRITKGPVPKNNPEDVKMVQLMLFANGIKGPLDGKCTAGLIKTIQAFQKSRLGYKKPDGVVDPGGATWKAGLAKLEAKIANDKKIAENMVMVVEGGKTKYIARAEYERNVNALKKKVLDKANMMYGQAESWVDFAREASATAAGSDGLMNSIASFAVSVVSSGKSDPPYGPMTDARSEASFLKALASSKNPDWKKIHAQDVKATKAYNAGKKAFDKWISTRISTASSIVGKLEVVREISFSVVEAYTTAQLVVTKGMSPTKAHAIAAAGTETMKSGAGQLGEYLAGNKITWEGAAKKVFLDAAFAGLAGAVGGKLSAAFNAKVTAGLASKLIPQVAQSLPQKAADLFLKKIMTTKAMEALITSGAKETIGLFKPLVEKGRAPTEKQVMDAIIKTVTAGALGASPFKILKAFSKSAPGKAGEFLNKTLVPKMTDTIRADMIKKFGADVVAKLPADFKSKMGTDALGAFKGKAAEIYALAAANGTNGDTKEAGLHKHGQLGLLKDAALRKDIEAMIRTKMEQKLKALETAN